MVTTSFIYPFFTLITHIHFSLLLILHQILKIWYTFHILYISSGSMSFIISILNDDVFLVLMISTPKIKALTTTVAATSLHNQKTQPPHIHQSHNPYQYIHIHTYTYNHQPPHIHTITYHQHTNTLSYTTNMHAYPHYPRTYNTYIPIPITY